MKVQTLLGRVANEKGLGKENKVVYALENCLDKPKWLGTSRKATREEDRKGADVICETDVGSLYLQVKSSHHGKEKFETKSRKKAIEVIVVKYNDTDQFIASKAIALLIKLRVEILKKRTGVNG